jgi:hypothetical protein
MQSPVLLIGFNRPDRLRAALDSIRDAAPRELYIAIDGPRGDSDEPRVAACQAIAREVAWAPTHTLFRPKNLGCQNAVVGAVSWFFSSVDAGVIIEDDSIPDPSFYRFCDELLARYAHEPRLLAIAGESRVPHEVIDDLFSYRFTYMGPAGAWATWSDRWHSFTETRSDRRPLALFRRLKNSDHSRLSLRAHWLGLMAANRTSVMDSWAYPFMVEGISSRRLTATPNVNLVIDEGVGDSASHMEYADRLAQPAGTLTFPLSHPPEIAVDDQSEIWSTHHEVNSGFSGLVGSGSRFARRILRRR